MKIEKEIKMPIHHHHSKRQKANIHKLNLNKTKNLNFLSFKLS
jgi:hypothetical protein